jgi:hypothetical protein
MVMFELRHYMEQISLKSHKKQAIILLILYGVGLAGLLFTNPQKLPLTLLIVPFVYAFITLFLTVKLIVTIFSGSKALGTSVGVIIAIFVVLSLILASIRQLSARDLLISFAITAILSWYLVKIRKL